MARGIRVVVLLFCWCAVAVAALAALLHFYPARHPLTIGLAAAAPLLMLAGVVAVVGFAVARTMIGLTVAVAVTMACIWIEAPLFVTDSVADGGTSLVAMHTNIELGQGDPGDIAELAQRHDVDVLAVTELTAQAADAIATTAVTQRFPYTYLQPQTFAAGTGVWSRYPIIAPRRLDGFVLAALEMTIAVPAGAGTKDVRFFAFHPPYPLDPVAWFDELGRISSTLAAVTPGVPVIAAGDYNASYDHVAYRQLLTDGYGDAGELAGEGWLPTYPADRFTGPLFAIDHVVVRGVDATALRTVPVAEADHLAVVADLRLPDR